jgi:fatty-acyl-CoA synthase
VLVNVNPAYRTHELTYAVNQSGLRFLIAMSGFKTSDYRGMVEATRADCPGLERVVYLDTDDWAALLAEGEAVPASAVAEALASLSPEEPINIQYTSGTTGYPKGATLSHRNILNNGFYVTELIDFTPEDRLCIPVPFYHCFGMVMGNLGCTTHAATMVIPGPVFDPETTLRCVAEERCTALYGVPTMFIAMQNHPTFAEHDLSSLRTGLMAGSICPVEVMKRCVTDMHMPEVGIAYGMTETSPVSCQTRGDDDLERRTATIGRVGPHLEIKVVDPATGETVERGETGELCTRGYSVMLGYWDDPEKTAEAIDADGWMHTGDLAEMREDGYCTIVGRIKDMVIRGGENIYPREIEEFLYAHPDVEDVQVVGVPDEKYGEELCAWIRLRAGAAPLTVEDVREFCAGKLSHYKLPRYVMTVEEFPMTVTGKVRKVAMREESAKQLGLG